jgi:uncharacterized phage protein (TIGR01671 family)
METPREILFRAKRIDNGEWIEGGYVHQIDNYGDKVDWHYIIEGTATLDYDIDEPIKVYPTTLSQFTGLYDKNGKRIFENDILKNNKGLIRQVKWEMSCGSCCTQVVGFGASGKGHTDFINLRDLEKIEIIGNIFDNADLIKEALNE